MWEEQIFKNPPSTAGNLIVNSPQVMYITHVHTLYGKGLSTMYGNHFLRINL
jgi:hypothetical protein